MIALPTILKEEPSKINDIQNQNLKKPKPYDYFTTKVQKSTIDMLCRLDKDERYLYFLKYGMLRRFEGEGEILYVEISQIPKNLVIYRRPVTRNKYSEKLYLNKKDLPHIPLLEGEEYLKLLSLESNLITKIDHLISLNNLLFLNLYENKISEIENLTNVPKLKALMLGKNQIEKIKNLNCLQELEVLDLHSNKIKLIENLSSLKKLRILNLANNQITSFVDLMYNKNLEELNLRKNLIVSIPNLTNNFEKIKKINLGKNMISKIEFLQEFKKLKKLSEIFIEDNPVLFLKDSYQKLVPLPIQFKDPQQLQQYINSKKKDPTPLNLSSNNTSNPLANSANSKSSSNLLKASNKNGETNNSSKTIMSTIENQEGTNLTEEERTKIIEKIKYEWDLEYRYITENGFNGYNIKKLKETKIQLCHVEIEREKQLNLFGNAVEVLTYNEFYNLIHTIQFEFLNFDIITQNHNLENLKKYTGLRSMIFSDNNLHSFYQLIKLEEIKGLEYLTIKNNEICNSGLLKYFLVYRLQNIKYFNDVEITNKDVLMSKKIFEHFDQAISYCETENEKKQNKKAKEKVNNQKSKTEKSKDKQENGSPIINKEENDPLKNSKDNNEESISKALINDENILKIKYVNYVKENLFTILDEIIDV